MTAIFRSGPSPSSFSLYRRSSRYSFSVRSANTRKLRGIFEIKLKKKVNVNFSVVTHHSILRRVNCVNNTFRLQIFRSARISNPFFIAIFFTPRLHAVYILDIYAYFFEHTSYAFRIPYTRRRKTAKTSRCLYQLLGRAAYAAPSRSPRLLIALDLKTRSRSRSNRAKNDEHIGHYRS